MVKSKTKMAAWFVSNCDAPSGRDQLTKKIQEFVDVDVYGDCGNLTCHRGSNKCDDLLNTTYKFYLSFENSLCLDYITEKTFNVMKNYVVPVVYNGANTSRFLPPHSFIDANEFKTVNDLVKYLKFLSNNPEEYAKFFWWKKYYVVQNNPYFDLSKICKKLNKIDLSATKKVYNDLKSWFVNCSSPKIKF